MRRIPVISAAQALSFAQRVIQHRKVADSYLRCARDFARIGAFAEAQDAVDKARAHKRAARALERVIRATADRLEGVNRIESGGRALVESHC